MDLLARFLDSVPVALREQVPALDELIRAAAPDLEPSLKWGNLTYHHTRNVCAIVAHAQHLNLQVWEATKIADPKKLLHGSGTRMRHATVHPGERLERDALVAIVRAAAKLQANHP